MDDTHTAYIFLMTLGKHILKSVLIKELKNQKSVER